MASKDYRHREQKKSKKDVKKILATSVQPPTPPVEVIKRGKKEQPEETQS